MELLEGWQFWNHWWTFEKLRFVWENVGGERLAFQYKVFNPSMCTYPILHRYTGNFPSVIRTHLFTNSVLIVLYSKCLIAGRFVNIQRGQYGYGSEPARFYHHAKKRKNFRFHQTFATDVSTGVTRLYLEHWSSNCFIMELSPAEYLDPQRGKDQTFNKSNETTWCCFRSVSSLFSALTRAYLPQISRGRFPLSLIRFSRKRNCSRIQLLKTFGVWDWIHIPSILLEHVHNCQVFSILAETSNIYIMIRKSN